MFLEVLYGIFNERFFKKNADKIKTLKNVKSDRNKKRKNVFYIYDLA